MGISGKTWWNSPLSATENERILNINSVFHASESVAPFNSQLLASVSYSLQTYGPWAECGMLNLFFGLYVVWVFISDWLPTLKIGDISSKKNWYFQLLLKNQNFWLHWAWEPLARVKQQLPLRLSVFSIVPTSLYCLILFPLHLFVSFA